MKILVACEESQAVTIELRRLGHEAWSCDIQDCSGGHPEWHLRCDALELLKMKWDMILAFPPCTYLTNAGARHLWKGHKLNEERYQKGLEAKDFFMAFYNADCPRIAVENPTPSRVFQMPEPSQTVQPWQFGHPFTKRTHLWLKGLPPLEPTKIVEPERTWCPSGSYSHKHGEQHRGVFTKDRSRNRAKTFPGIARAMAEQWAGPCGEITAMERLEAAAV